MRQLFFFTIGFLTFMFLLDQFIQNQETGIMRCDGGEH